MRFVVRAKDDCLGIGHPDEASDPVIEPLREVLSLPAFPVVQHQPGAITFVSGTKLGTVRNVPAIRRIEGRGVAGRIVGRRGVERERGKKDPAKVKAFIQAVREADRSQ